MRASREAEPAGSVERRSSAVWTAAARLAVDIGGTFTDLALEQGGRLVTTKVLTTPSEPERGVLAGVAKIMAEAEVAPEAVGLIIHGTTLATNAIIERPAAKRGRMVNRTWGEPSSQLHERHDASDFELKTQDKVGGQEG